MAAVLTPRIAEAPLWDALPGLVLLLRRDGAVPYANQAFVDRSGLSREQLGAAAWLDELTADSQAALRAVLARRAIALPTLRWHADGRSSVRVDGVLGWRDDDHALCLLRELPEPADAAVQPVATQSQAGLFRLLADNVPALIAYYEIDGFRCRFANKQYARTFGLDEQSIIGRSFAEVIGKEAAAQIQPHVKTAATARHAGSRSTWCRT
jgi:PAS domain-containing protein